MTTIINPNSKQKAESRRRAGVNQAALRKTGAFNLSKVIERDFNRVEWSARHLFYQLQ
ncbi:MAG: hypothetical protein ABR860_08620 [Terracidiphilus sp.]|jgi:hypothetical protein